MLKRILFAILFISCQSVVAFAEPRFGFNPYTKPKHDSGFKHFEFVNPDAPKGGEIKLGLRNSFISINSFNLKSASLLLPNNNSLEGMLFDGLLQKSADEVASYYCHLCEWYDVVDDYTLRFKIKNKGKWHDGTNITIEDIKFTFDILREKGNPIYKVKLNIIKEVKIIDDEIIEFKFNNPNKNIVITIGDIPIISRKFWEGKDFENYEGTILSSGPYMVEDFKYRSYIKLKRVKDYWGVNEPTMKGMYNFDSILFKFYSDDFANLESFFAGELDYREENVSRYWKKGYTKVEKNPKFKKIQRINNSPSGLQAFFLNLNSPALKDITLRKALAVAFDFDWMNKHYFYDAYDRKTTLYQTSPFDSDDQKEFSITRTWADPDRLRRYLENMKAELEAHGYKSVDNQLISPLTKKPVVLEIIDYQTPTERIYLKWAENLAKLGIKLNIWMSDEVSCETRLQQDKYDIISRNFSPFVFQGVLEEELFTSKAARPGGYNYSKIQDSKVDKLIQSLRSSEDLKQTKLLAAEINNIILGNYYLFPAYFDPNFRYAYWDKFGIPEKVSDTNIGFWAWWIK